MRVLGLMAKFWEPGAVKTRLAARIGAERAALVQRSLLRALTERLADCGDRRFVVYSPAERREDFAELAGPAWDLVPQATGDLGARMADFFEGHLASTSPTSPPRVVLLGADSPNLPLARVEAAWDALTEADVVLGPSDDGGYYLVGLARHLPPIFADMPWSTAEVWPRTIVRLEQAGARYRTLEPWYDVDEWDELERLRDELRQPGAETDSALARLREELNQMLGD